MIYTLLRYRGGTAALAGAFLAASLCVSASAQKPKITKVKPDKTGTGAPAKPDKTDTSASVEPDKVLYDRAMLDMKKGHYTEGRLSLQTLINTYPDSEYLAKAKLGVADSYFREGGTSNMTIAVQEYKDFITFFPFLDEAAYAQMQVGMTHYRMMEKTDRDKSDAEAAEDEFQTFLLKYPQSPLVPKAEQSLREVQEIIADGQYRIARFYYLKMDYRASAARLVELTERYPLYSQSDDALWMLGDVYEKAKKYSKNEDDKNHWADLAAKCYDRIVTDYPLSNTAPTAKSRLTAMGMAIPAADPNAVARMQKEQLYQKQHTQHAMLRAPIGALKSSPDVSASAHEGQPNLNPPDDAVSATDVLSPGASGPSFNLAARVPVDNANSDSMNNDTSPPVEAVPVQSSGTATNGVGAEIIAAPPSAEAAARLESSHDTSSAATPDAQPAAEQSPGSVPTINMIPPPPGATAPDASQNGATSTSSSSSSTTQGATGNNGDQSVAPSGPSKVDPDTESTSKKKKKGLHKLVPF